MPAIAAGFPRRLDLQAFSPHPSRSRAEFCLGMGTYLASRSYMIDGLCLKCWVYMYYKHNVS